MGVSSVLGGILFSFALFSASAATWYVDSSVGTSGNGTAWGTAWQALSNVTGVKAGDTVYISGGASGSSQTYSVSSWKPAGGAAGNPINYQIGQDSAHNGTAIFSGSGTWFGGASNVIISGDAGDGAMHFSCTGYGTAASINGDSNLRISYVNLGSNLSDGMDGQNVGSFELDHCYAYISDVSADHFFSVGFNGTTWDQNLIHDNTIYCPHLSSNANGADFFQIGGSGYTLYNNLLVGYNHELYRRPTSGRVADIERQLHQGLREHLPEHPEFLRVRGRLLRRFFIGSRLQQRVHQHERGGVWNRWRLSRVFALYVQ